MAYLASITNSIEHIERREMYIIRVHKQWKHHYKLPTKITGMIPDLYFDDQNLICVCISGKKRCIRKYRFNISSALFILALIIKIQQRT